MSPCPKTVAWNPFIPGNWEFFKLCEKMFKWVFRSCLAAWYDLRNGELIWSDMLIWYYSLTFLHLLSPSIWTFEFISKLTVSNVIHKVLVIVSASNSLSFSIVMNPLWLQSVIISLVLWIFSLVSLSSHFLFIFFKESGCWLLENSQNGLFIPLGLPFMDFTTGMFIG